MPVAPGMIPKSVAVMDLTYRRGRTPWVSACRSRGLRAEDGLPMLIEQGALAFERWFGVPPDREAMWASVRS
jgi:shikimate dehydrogenase